MSNLITAINPLSRHIIPLGLKIAQVTTIFYSEWQKAMIGLSLEYFFN